MEVYHYDRDISFIAQYCSFIYIVLHYQSLINNYSCDENDILSIYPYSPR